MTRSKRTNVSLLKIFFEDILSLHNILAIISGFLLLYIKEYLAIIVFLLVFFDIITNAFFDLKYLKLFDIEIFGRRHYSSINFRIRVLYLSCDIVFILLIGVAMIANMNQLASYDFGMFIKKIIAPHVYILPTVISFAITALKLQYISRLGKKDIKVYNINSAITLGEVETLCACKEGALTDGIMKLKIIVPLTNIYNDNNIKQIISNIINSTNDEDLVSHSIRRNVSYEVTNKATAVCRYNKDNNYSGASFGTRGTFLIGTIDSLNLNNKKGLSFRADEYTSKGYIVYVLSHSNAHIIGEHFHDVSEPIAFLVFEDNLRDGIEQLVEYVKENDIDLKLFSSKSPFYASETARSIGINKSDKYTSIQDNNSQNIGLLAEKCNVFGDLSPSDKNDLVCALAPKKNTMVLGNSIEDINAMYSSHSSICFDDANENAKLVADAVIGRYDLSLINLMIDDSKKVIGKVRNLFMLFLPSAFFSIVLSLMFSVLKFVDTQFVYPFTFSQLTIINVLYLFIPSLFIVLEPNESITSNRHYIYKPVTIGIFALIYSSACYTLFILRNNGYIYEGISRDIVVAYQQAKTMTLAITLIFGLAVLYSLYYKNNKYRKVTYLIISGVSTMFVAGLILISIITKSPIEMFEIDFSILSLNNWIMVLCLSLLLSVVYLYINYLFDSHNMRKDKKNVKD